ncbi:MAG: DNA-binding protein [Thermoprotei archaeon]|nr:MAG: DNA-binding protein [Thermoprotei archaeon]
MSLRKALRAALKGPLTPERLAEELGITVEEAEALIGALLSHGYLEELRPRSCASCPLAPICGVRGKCSVKIYMLTKKGRRLLSDAPS